MRKVNVSEVIANSKLNGRYIAIFLVCLFVIIFNGYNQSIYGISLPSMMADGELLNEMNMSAEQATAMFGNIASMTLLGMFIGSLVFGAIADRIGRVKAMILGLILFCVGDAMIGIAHSGTMITICRLVAGFGMAGVVPICIPTVTEYSPLKNRTVLSSWCTSGVPLGAIFTPLICLALLPAIGWRNMYLTCLIPLVTIIFIVWLVPESMERLVAQGKNEKIRSILGKLVPDFETTPEDEYVTASREAGMAKSSVKDLFTEGRSLTTILFWVAFFCSMMFTYALQTWLPSMLVASGREVSNALIFTFVYAAGSVPFILMTGPLTKRFGFKWAVAGLMGLAAISMALLALNPPDIIMYILLFLAGGGMYGETAIFYSYVSNSYPNSVRSTAVGFSAASGRIGGILGPQIGVVLTAAGAGMSTMCLVYAAPMLIAAVCIALTREKFVE